MNWENLQNYTLLKLKGTQRLLGPKLLFYKEGTDSGRHLLQITHMHRAEEHQNPWCSTPNDLSPNRQTEHKSTTIWWRAQPLSENIYNSSKKNILMNIWVLRFSHSLIYSNYKMIDQLQKTVLNSQESSDRWYLI